MTGNSLTGTPASPGYFTGKGYVVPKSEIWTFQPPKEPYVLVTETTSPDYFALMYQAGGIVTTTGGAASHAATVARELGKPAVVAVLNATQLLGGKMISVDGTNGIVSYQDFIEPKPETENWGKSLQWKLFKKYVLKDGD
ncbi:hypothetical protein A3K63_02460 [Candidatus Micrarchaeota archaeon RBG_16_49_10]|nr:MAG: hypothetical protein A3K63_02460 [Candidatus Micrarchaeota archaeon RBG_16_49_10]